MKTVASEIYSRLMAIESCKKSNNDEWLDKHTDHVITVRPSFGGLDLTISGKNKNDIKEYLSDVYYYALTKEV